MSAATVPFVCAMAYRFAELRPLLQDHVDDNDGEVLPHLFLADVERWVESEATRGASGNGSVFDSVLAFIEEAYDSGGAEIEELISVSFLEHLPRDGLAAASINSRIGARLAEQLQRIG